MIVNTYGTYGRMNKLLISNTVLNNKVMLLKSEVYLIRTLVYISCFQVSHNQKM